MCLRHKFILIAALWSPLLTQDAIGLAPLKLAPAREVLLEREPYGITEGGLSPKGTFLSAHFSGATWIWDARTGACLKTWQDRQSAVGFSQDEGWLALWDPSGAWLEVWDWTNRKQVRRLGPFPVIPKAQGWDQPYRFIPGAGGTDLWILRHEAAGPLRGWDLSSGRCLGDLAPGRVKGDPLFFEGKLALFTPDRASVSLWNPGEGRKLQEISLLPPDLPQPRKDVQRTTGDLRIEVPRIQDERLVAEIHWAIFDGERSTEPAWIFSFPFRGGDADWNAIPSPAPAPIRPARDRLGIRTDFSTGKLFLERNNDWRTRLPLEAEIWKATCFLPLPERGALIQGGSDGSLRLWDLRGDRRLATLALPPELRAITRISAGSRMLLMGEGKQVIAFGSGPIDLFDLQLGRFVTRLGGMNNLDGGVARIDEYHALVSTNEGLALWDLRAPTMLHVWKKVHCGSVSSDGHYLAFVQFPQEPQSKSELQVWDLKNMSLLGRIQPKGEVRQCRFTDDSLSLSVVSMVQDPDRAGGLTGFGLRPDPGPSTLHLGRWSLETTPRQLEHLEKDALKASAKWTPQGFVLGPFARPSGIVGKPAEVPLGELTSLDGCFLLTVPLRSDMHLLDRRTGRSWNLGRAWAAEERFLFMGEQLVGMSATRLRYWDLGALEAKWLSHRVSLGAPAAGMVFSPNGTNLAVLESTGLLRLVEVRSGKVLQMLGEIRPGTEITGARADRFATAPGGGVRNLPPLQQGRLAFSPDGSLLVATTSEGRITVFESATGLVRSVHVLPEAIRGARLALENSGRVLLGTFEGDSRKEALRWTKRDLQGNSLLSVPCPRWAYGWGLLPSPAWDYVAQLPESSQGDLAPERFQFVVCESKGRMVQIDEEAFGGNLAAWSPAENRLAFLMGDGRLTLWQRGQNKLDSIWFGKPLNALAWLRGKEDRLLVGEGETFKVLDPRDGATLANSGPIPTRPASSEQWGERLWASSPAGNACAVAWVGSQEVTIVMVPPVP